MTVRTGIEESKEEGWVGWGVAKNGVVNGVESSKLITADQRQSLAFEA